MEVFQDYAYYYNAFYKDKDYKTEAAQFELIENLDCNTLDKTTYDSWTSYFIAKAI